MKKIRISTIERLIKEDMFPNVDGELFGEIQQTELAGKKTIDKSFFDSWVKKQIDIIKERIKTVKNPNRIKEAFEDGRDGYEIFDGIIVWDKKELKDIQRNLEKKIKKMSKI